MHLQFKFTQPTLSFRLSIGIFLNFLLEIIYIFCKAAIKYLNDHLTIVNSVAGHPPEPGLAQMSNQP